MTTEEYHTYVFKDSHFHSLHPFEVFSRQSWMTETGKQIGEVKTTWLCQLNELGFCSKSSFLLCVSNLNYDS